MTKRQKLLLKKAIDCLEDVSGYDIEFSTKGYDDCDFDPATLADDMKIEFDFE